MGSKRYLTWLVRPEDVKSGVNVGAEYVMDMDYTPVSATVRSKLPSNFNNLIVDVNDDGVSIFSNRPNIPRLYQTDEGHLLKTPIREGSIITLDIDQYDSEAGDITVELLLEGED